MKEKHDSSGGDERDAAYLEISNKLNSLGLMPRAIATFLKLDAKPTQVEQCPEEETEAIILWWRRRHAQDIAELKERHASYPCSSDEQIEVARKMLNKLNSLGMVPNAIARHLELNEGPVEMQSSHSKLPRQELT